MSNYIYKLFIFTSTNILVSLMIEYYRNKYNNSSKLIDKFHSLDLTSQTEFNNNLNNKIDNIKNSIHYLNKLLITTNEVIQDIDLKINDFKKEVFEIKMQIENHKEVFENKMSEKIIDKLDKTTSTEALFEYDINYNLNNSVNKNICQNNKISDDGIIVENEIDLIDDVYDYFPCHNFKKQTVYDILLHNLTK